MTFPDIPEDGLMVSRLSSADELRLVQVQVRTPFRPLPSGGPTPPPPGAAGPQTRNWKVGQYKPPLSMRRTLDRAHAAQPPLIALSGSTATEKVFRSKGD